MNRRPPRSTLFPDPTLSRSAPESPPREPAAPRGKEPHNAVPTGMVNRFSRLTMPVGTALWGSDRKSTRLNSSHSQISYAVFCLKKNKLVLQRALVLLVTVRL